MIAILILVHRHHILDVVAGILIGLVEGVILNMVGAGGLTKDDLPRCGEVRPRPPPWLTLPWVRRTLGQVANMWNWCLMSFQFLERGTK